MLGLAVNTQNPLLEMNVSYWAGIFREKDGAGTITCFVQAVSGEVNCLDFTDVNSDNLNETELSVYPNPSHELALIRIPQGVLQGIRTAVLYDLKGNKVIDFTNIITQSGLGNVAIPISTLPAGIYFVRIESQTITESVQLNINK